MEEGFTLPASGFSRNVDPGRFSRRGFLIIIREKG